MNLELESAESLDLIAQEFGEKVDILHNGATEEGFVLVAEVLEGEDNDPDSIIAAFCDLITALTPKAKAVWKNATARRFDIGIASGKAETREYDAICLSLSPETLKRITTLSAEVLVTVYSPEVFEPEVKKAPKAKAKAKAAPAKKPAAKKAPAPKKAAAKTAAKAPVKVAKKPAAAPKKAAPAKKVAAKAPVKVAKPAAKKAVAAPTKKAPAPAKKVTAPAKAKGK